VSGVLYRSSALSLLPQEPSRRQGSVVTAGVVYVSYDGALDPLGASQVIPYIEGLARTGLAFTLISFEKADRWRESRVREQLNHRFEGAGVRWRPLAYHRRPRLPATVWDLLRGTLVVRHEVRLRAAKLVHCRGDVAMTMARWARLPAETKVLYDLRGFFSDERAESGSWRRGGFIDRFVRAAEDANWTRADGLITLTRAARRRLTLLRGELPPNVVIPTCVDLASYTADRLSQAREYGVVYAGSFGQRYMPRETVNLIRVAQRELPGKALVLTPDAAKARAAGLSGSWVDVLTVAPSEVASWLSRAQASVFLYRPGIQMIATCPTRFAESLAAGVPVVANRGIGDLDEMIEQGRVGVLLRGFSDTSFAEGVKRISALLRDTDIRRRCRRFAEQHLELTLGVRRYERVYSQLLT
jgi:glycosyltransferase involved in cell wall biosynthesis